MKWPKCPYTKKDCKNAEDEHYFPLYEAIWQESANAHRKVAGKREANIKHALQNLVKQWQKQSQRAQTTGYINGIDDCARDIIEIIEQLEEDL